MCGIFGLITDNKDFNFQIDKLNSALDLLGHRGPDGSGKYIEKGVFIGHKRLSIIDVVSGAQPMKSNDNRYVITFNGEIFNFHELKLDLENKGYIFNSNSDTEVVLASYAIYGPPCVNLFNGMFAFAIWDKQEQKLFVARDRFGMKPLFYHLNHNSILFSSEIKSIYRSGILPFKPKLDNFNEFLIFGYIAGEETLHDDILELEPGHILTWYDKKIEKRQYWTPLPKTITDTKNIIELVERKLITSVRTWLTADVEVASLLSGGIDSNILTVMADNESNGIRTFSATLPDDPINDEKELIQLTSKELKGDHHLIKVEGDFLKNNFIKLVEHFDDPIHDSNYFTLMAICAKIREISDIKVVISGEGADEVFGGYKRYNKIANEYYSGDLDTLLYSLNHVAIPRLKLFTNDPVINNKTRYNILNEVMSEDIFNTLLFLDQKTFLGSYLHRQDRVGMMFGLEIRTPFLDHNLVQTINGLPSYLKYDDNYRKLLLREVGEKYINKRIIWNRSKIAFSFPINELLKTGFLNRLYKEMFNDGLELEKIYSPDGLIKLLHYHENGHDHSNTLWRILCLEYWLRYMNNTYV